MSNYKQPQTRPTWQITAGIAGAVIVLIVIIAAVAGSQPTFEPEVKGAPRAEFDQITVDHGVQHFGQTVESVFTVHNTGDQPLVIKGEPRVEIIEGCCPPRTLVSSMAIKPGEQATIRLQYTMHEGMGGQHEFRIHVLTNDPAQLEIPLTALSLWEA